jgi:hypothetical protein
MRALLTKGHTIERSAIVFLFVLLVWFGAAIVRLEKYHYASQVGLCSELNGLDSLVEKDKCLSGTETRTHWSWHLLYGLRVF